jgi:uncharacterized protein (TIGR03435 family)
VKPYVSSKTLALVPAFLLAGACLAADITVKPSEAMGAARFGFDNGALNAQGIPLRMVLSMAFNIPQSRIDGPDWLDEPFDIRMPADAPGPAMNAKLKAELMSALHMDVEEVKRDLNAMVVKAGSDVKLKTSTSGPRVEMRPDGLQAESQTMAQILRHLERAANKPLVDETGLTGRYDIALDFTPGDAGSVKQGLEALGLKVEEQKRNLPVLVIKKMDRPKSE